MSTISRIVIVRPSPTTILDPPPTVSSIIDSSPSSNTIISPQTDPTTTITQSMTSSTVSVTRIVVNPSESILQSAKSTSTVTSTSSTVTSTLTSSSARSSVLVTSVTGSSPTSAPSPSETSLPSDSGPSSSPVLVTTISVVVGGILLALLAAWLIHMFIKSRREKKENDRLATDEDLDGMFQPPVMSTSRKPYWDQAEQNHRNSIISIGNDYPIQSADMNNNFISRAQDLEDSEIPESRQENNSSVTQRVGALGEPGAALVGVNLLRHGTMGSTSTSPLIQNSSTGNFVISDYSPARPDELTLRQGQILLLEQTFQDGWAYGKNTATQDRGMFPYNFVAPVDPSIFQQSFV